MIKVYNKWAIFLSSSSDGGVSLCNGLAAKHYPVHDSEKCHFNDIISFVF